MSSRAIAVAGVAMCLHLPALAANARTQPDPQDLKAMSIEQLMETDVTLASREPEPIGRTAAAITVITGDDIRRAGVTTIADALALADGVHVARFNNGTWAVSARGFNATSANKLLVMIDGRIEYSPLFSGTFWNMLDYALEDIDRIEVIRGPGATLWGASGILTGDGPIQVAPGTSDFTDAQWSFNAPPFVPSPDIPLPPPDARRAPAATKLRGSVARLRPLIEALDPARAMLTVQLPWARVSVYQVVEWSGGHTLRHLSQIGRERHLSVLRTPVGV